MKNMFFLPGSTIAVDEQPVVQTMAFFSPASYNLPQFRYAHLPASEVRNAWISWIRWFENVMTASNIFDGHSRKAQMLAMGGIELQSVFYGTPGADVDGLDGSDPYVTAKDKLSEHFAPKQHDSFERFQFWTMKPERDEPIEKFLLRVQQKAEKCSFGKTEHECRQTAIIDKIIQNAPDELRRKLLEKDHLTLDVCSKIVNAHQSVIYQAEQMKPKSDHPADINHVYARKPRFSEPPAYKDRCNHCGWFKHQMPEQCPAFGKKCHRCGNEGHFQSRCKPNSKNVRILSYKPVL